ncbi:MAG TPA: hypothetical protein VGO09_05835, partial [Flavisolibacter sp.]|nr:hypothetical protein [Flavisolibacter sp.]
MSHPKSKPLKSKESLPGSLLKKIPRSKAASKKTISIDVRTDKKNYAGIIDLAKRKLANQQKSEMPVNIKPMLAS